MSTGTQGARRTSSAGELNSTAHSPAPPRAPRRGELRVVHGREEVDLDAAERAVSQLLEALGKDPSSPHLADTPRRVASSYAELLTPREFDLTTFPNDEG